MRQKFARELYRWMEQDPTIWLITADLGYGLWDKIREDFPERFINTGAAEQAAMGIAVGLALQGNKPFIYSITPFLLWRAAETIRIYINHEQIPVRLIGGGRHDDYKHDGFSHNASDDRKLMQVFSNIQTLHPNKEEDIRQVVQMMVQNNWPWYVNLRR